jgi:phosphoserine phosphatase RsbU/P
VCQNVPSSKYVTFFLAALDPASGRLDYVNAGHNPPSSCAADGTWRRSPRAASCSGCSRAWSTRADVVDLRPGDTLVVYSDGVTETWDPDGEEFGEESLVALCVRNRALGAEALQESILREIERFEAGARATDDRTIVVLKREGGQP